MIAAFALWCVAFVATAVGFWFNLFGRSALAVLALTVCVTALAGMFLVGRRGSR